MPWLFRGFEIHTRGSYNVWQAAMTVHYGLCARARYARGVRNKERSACSDFVGCLCRGKRHFSVTVRGWTLGANVFASSPGIKCARD